MKYIILPRENDDIPNLILPYSSDNEERAKELSTTGNYTIEDIGEPTAEEQLRADVDFLLAMGGVL